MLSQLAQGWDSCTLRSQQPASSPQSCGMCCKPWLPALPTGNNYKDFGRGNWEARFSCPRSQKNYPPAKFVLSWMCGQECHLVKKQRDTLQPHSPYRASPMPLAASSTPPCWTWCPAQRTKPWQCCSWCQSTWWRQGSCSSRRRELLQGCPQVICHCACWSCDPPWRVFHLWRDKFGQLDCSWALPGGAWT